MNNGVMKIGVIVEVDGDYSKVGVYSLINDPLIIENGEILNGPKLGAYLVVQQNDIRIIVSVVSEKIVDQQNNINSEEFDNRFKKQTINRVLLTKTKGVIKKHGFIPSNKYVPMVGNQVTIASKEDIDCIYGVSNPEETIEIGKSLIENYPVKIQINNFFASHIGIFGNTGSGKSNTLHKLYYELFQSKWIDGIKERSKFFVIDFNGEYCTKDIFGLDRTDRRIIKINTRKITSGHNKIKVKKEYLFNPDILAILFDARPATQVPFLKQSLKKFNEISNSLHFADMNLGLLKNILINIRGNSNIDYLQEWIDVFKTMGPDSELYKPLNEIKSHVEYGNQELRHCGTLIVKDSQVTDEGYSYLKLGEIKNKLSEYYSAQNEIYKLKIFLEFQRVFAVSYNSYKNEHIGPLFARIRTSIESLDKVVNVVDKLDIRKEYRTMNIISLVNANAEITRLIPMLLSKMIYDEHKEKCVNNEVLFTTHLIIDEAHNILNSQYRNVGDDWQDYRLSIFEEIIKEGRKFGFYLTISSQRPADISPTIMSQIHNYIIHRIVNEKDLGMLFNTMPTLDKYSYKMLPTLGKGEAVITGTSINVPIMTKVERISKVHPKSDDIDLIKLWET